MLLAWLPLLSPPGEITDLPNFPPFPESWASPTLDVRDCVPADADGDGLREIVAGAAESGEGLVVLFEADGAGGWAEVYRTPLAERPPSPIVAVASADTDGDGLRELVALAGSELWMWERSGNDDYDARGVVAVASPDPTASPTALRVGDLDDDGSLELVFAFSAGELSGDSSVHVREHTGAAGANTYASVLDHTLAAPFSLRALTVGDSDANGDREIVLTGLTDNDGVPSFRLLEFAAGGVDVHDVTLAGFCGSLFAPALGDFDFDGVRELAFSASMDCPGDGFVGTGVYVLEPTADHTYDVVYREAPLALTPRSARAPIGVGEFSCLPFPTPVVAGGPVGATGAQVWSWHPEGYDAILGAPIVTGRTEGLVLRDLDQDGAPEAVFALPGEGVAVHEQHVWCYGSNVNPIESLLVLGGEPALGTLLTLGVDDPTDSHGAGSTPFVVLSTAPDPNFPAGTLLPGFGMAAGTTPGELLVSFTVPHATLVGVPWIGATFPAAVEVPIPNLAILSGLELYAQGVMFDPSLHGAPHWGLAEGMVLPIE